jgi:hypothetical protein
VIVDASQMGKQSGADGRAGLLLGAPLQPLRNHEHGQGRKLRHNGKCDQREP